MHKGNGLEGKLLAYNNVIVPTTAHESSGNYTGDEGLHMLRFDSSEGQRFTNRANVYGALVLGAATACLA